MPFRKGHNLRLWKADSIESLCREEIDLRLGCWAREEVVCQAHHGNVPVAD